MLLSELPSPLRGTSLREGSRKMHGCKEESSIMHIDSHRLTELPKPYGLHSLTKPPL